MGPRRRSRPALLVANHERLFAGTAPTTVIGGSDRCSGANRRIIPVAVGPLDAERAATVRTTRRVARSLRESAQRGSAWRPSYEPSCEPPFSPPVQGRPALAAATVAGCSAARRPGGTMRRQRVTEDELRGAVRKERTGSMDDVEALVFEPNGEVSVVTSVGDGSALERVLPDDRSPRRDGS